MKVCKYNRCKNIPNMGFMHCHEFPECQEEPKPDLDLEFRKQEYSDLKEMIKRHYVLFRNYGGNILWEDVKLLEAIRRQYEKEWIE